MNASELGKKLVDYFNAGKHEEIIEELYSPQIKSYEADGMLSDGLDALKQKWDWWMNAFQVHGTKATGPYPHGEDKVAVVFWLDVTHKESGQRSQSDEVAVYEVKDGRIAEERFFYPQP